MNFKTLSVVVLITLSILIPHVVFGEAVLPENPLAKYGVWQYYPEAQEKRNHLDTLLLAFRYNSLKAILVNDTSLSNLLTFEEKYLLKSIVYGPVFISDRNEIDSLFADSNVTTKMKRKFDVSPYQKLLYTIGAGDQLIIDIYCQYWQCLDSLQRNGSIDDTIREFFSRVFPSKPETYAASQDAGEHFIKKYAPSRLSEILYDFYYTRSKWKKSGFLLGTGMALHWFGGEAGEMFLPNPGWNMLYCNILIKGVSLGGGVNFTGHTINPEKQGTNAMNSYSNINFSQLYLSSGYCFSYKDRLMAIPYCGIARVFNNLPKNEVDQLGKDPVFPKMTVFKTGSSFFINPQKTEKLQNIFERQFPLITLDFGFENYDLRHFGIKNRAFKYYLVFGFSALVGKKQKLVIE